METDAAAQQGGGPFPARPWSRWLWGARTLSTAVFFLFLLPTAASGAPSGPGLTENVKPSPQGAFPAQGSFPAVCSLQCHIGALSNGDRGITVDGSLYPLGNATCGVYVDGMRVSAATPADPDGRATMRSEEQGLASRVFQLLRSRSAARDRAIETDEEYFSRPFFSALCPVQQQALVHETLRLNVLGLQRNSLMGAVSRRVGSYDVIGYRCVLGVRGGVGSNRQAVFLTRVPAFYLGRKESRRRGRLTAADRSSLALRFCIGLSYWPLIPVSPPHPPTPLPSPGGTVIERLR